MPESLVRGDSPKIGRDVGTDVENRKMITQALSYRPVDRTTPPGPRTGKGGLRPVDSVHLIDAARAKMVTASEAREPDGCRDYSNRLLDRA